MATEEETLKKGGDKVATPRCYEDAMKSPQAELWRDACNAEMKSMYENKVFKQVQLTPTIKVIDSMWVLKVKRKSSGVIKKFKAKFVTKGFTQRESGNYWKTFASTVAASALRAFLTVCMVKKMKIHQVDVATAFLNVDIDGEVYMKPPKEYCKQGCVWKLKKSIYGFKQSPRCWATKLNDVLSKLGRSHLKADRCIFNRAEPDGSLSYMLIYVDDFLLAANSNEKMNTIKKELKKFRLIDMGVAGGFATAKCVSCPP